MIVGRRGGTNSDVNQPSGARRHGGRTESDVALKAGQQHRDGVNCHGAPRMTRLTRVGNRATPDGAIDGYPPPPFVVTDMVHFSLGDLDAFKEVNDPLGHEPVIARLLVQVW